MTTAQPSCEAPSSSFTVNKFPMHERHGVWKDSTGILVRLEADGNDGRVKNAIKSFLFLLISEIIHINTKVASPNFLDVWFALRHL